MSCRAPSIEFLTLRLCLVFARVDMLRTNFQVDVLNVPRILFPTITTVSTVLLTLSDKETDVYASKAQNLKTMYASRFALQDHIMT